MDDETGEPVDAPDLVPGADGLEAYDGSGHVAGPWHPDELAALDGDD